MVRYEYISAFLVDAVGVVNSFADKCEKEQPIAKIVAIDPDALADKLFSREQKQWGVKKSEHGDNGHKAEAAPKCPQKPESSF